jgi:hypothetical protein
LTDFITETKDSNPRRRKKNFSRTSLLKKRRLNPDAVPSKFENLPPYLSKKTVQPRSGKALGETRRLQENSDITTRITAFFDAEKFRDLDHLDHLLSEATMPAGVAKIKRKDRIILLYIEDSDGELQIGFTLTVFENGSFLLKKGTFSIPKKVTHFYWKKIILFIDFCYIIP